MKIILISPSFGSHTVAPPVGLGYLASTLLDRGYEVEILDPAKDGFRLENAGEYIKKRNPDLIGVSILTPRYNSAKRLINEIKLALPDVPIVVGGVHVSALPVHTLKELKLNYGVIGEGESTFPELLNTLQSGGELNNLKGIVFDREGKIHVNEKRPLIRSLDSIPFPAWHLMKPGDYPPIPHQFFFERYPIAPIITSRGCPHVCKFCASAEFWGRRYRMRSAKNVVDEIELLVQEYGVKEIHIEDDNFTLVKKHAMQICREIVNRGIDIRWKCPNGVRVDGIDRELLQLMKSSGCYQIAFGIESGNQKTLDSMNKNLDLNRVRQVVKTSKDVGLEVHGFFIIGFPGETYENAMETVRFSKSIGLDVVNFASLAYLPGAELFNERVRNKGIGSIDFSDVNYFSPTSTDELSEHEIKQIQRNAFNSFYMKPEVLFNHMKKLKLKQIPYLIKMIQNYYT